jgi:hypothetical protein
MDNMYSIISLGIDCSIAYQLCIRNNNNHLKSPFDWMFCEKITDIIELIDNKFNDFTKYENYELLPIKSTTFFGLNNALEIHKRANFIMKHKYYKIRLPHELETIDDILKFKTRYNELICEFYSYNNIYDKIKFVRLGKEGDAVHINKLYEVLGKYFDNFVIEFVNVSKYVTTDWKKNELPWEDIFNGRYI